MIRYFYLLYVPVTVVLIIYFILFLKALSQLANSAAVIENKSQETEKLLSELDTKAQILENYQQKTNVLSLLLSLFLSYSHNLNAYLKRKRRNRIFASLI